MEPHYRVLKSAFALSRLAAYSDLCSESLWKCITNASSSESWRPEAQPNVRGQFRHGRIVVMVVFFSLRSWSSSSSSSSSLTSLLVSTAVSFVPEPSPSGTSWPVLHTSTVVNQENCFLIVFISCWKAPNHVAQYLLKRGMLPQQWSQLRFQVKSM